MNKCNDFQFLVFIITILTIIHYIQLNYSTTKTLEYTKNNLQILMQTA